MIQINKASIIDIKEATRLAYSALKSYGNYLAISNDIKTIFKRFEIFYQHRLKNQLHQDSFSIVRVNNQVVASSTSYKGELIPLYNQNICTILQELDVNQEKLQDIYNCLPFLKEAESDEYYIDTIAVKEEYKGKGLANMLIKFLGKKAREEGLEKLAIVVEEGKEYLIPFYEKNGFKVFESRTLAGINYYRMIKNLL